MSLSSIFLNIPIIGDIVRDALATPDPRRFATTGATPYNWNGEHSGTKEVKGGAILVDEVRRVFEFGRYSNEEIPDYLTDLDKEGLRAYKLDPENPAYTSCKEYFSKNPYCHEHELAANSSGEFHKGIKANTAVKVLAAFRVGLVDKPTF